MVAEAHTCGNTGPPLYLLWGTGRGFWPHVLAVCAGRGSGRAPVQACGGVHSGATPGGQGGGVRDVGGALRGDPALGRGGRGKGATPLADGWPPGLGPPSRPPPPPLSGLVGPNFSHHKARVQAVGWSPLGTRKQESRPFAAPPPPPTEMGPKAGPAQPPPPPPPPA